MFRKGCVAGLVSCLMGRCFYLSRTLGLFWAPKRQQCRRGKGCIGSVSIMHV